MFSFTPNDLPIKDFHAYLLGSVAPRPIALASTVDSSGNVNLSPFSFFNVFGSNPPTLIFSPNKRVRDGSTKDTLENVKETGEVVINMVDYSMVQQISLASHEYPKGTNEFKKAGFTEQASTLVKPPRVSESKVAFECIVKQIISMGDGGGAANLVICEVVMMHISESILAENRKIDHQKTDWVARMGSDWYCRASGNAIFEVEKPGIEIGVGVDKIPDCIKQNRIFTTNDWGKLGSISEIPDKTDIGNFRAENSEEDFLLLAKEFLDKNEIKSAWLAILAAKNA